MEKRGTSKVGVEENTRLNQTEFSLKNSAMASYVLINLNLPWAAVPAQQSAAILAQSNSPRRLSRGSRARLPRQATF